MHELVDMDARLWGYSPETLEALRRERLDYLRFPGRRGGTLLARVGGVLVGLASWRDSADGRAVYLTGAATLPKDRGRGVYAALLARRLRDARERGAEIATVQANPDTSSPILRRRGFEKLCEVRVYVSPGE